MTGFEGEHMSAVTGQNRVFLFLQGPHGPFFYKLGRMLRRSGAEVWRVGFNAGDAAFWREKDSFIAFQDPIDSWRARFAAIVAEKGVTDIVLYGDTRRIHAEAIEEARSLNHNYVGTEHLLLGLLREHDGVAAQVLMNLGLKLEDVREEVLNLLGHGVDGGEAGPLGVGHFGDEPHGVVLVCERGLHRRDGRPRFLGFWGDGVCG